MQILFVIDDIAWKATLYAKESHTSKVIYFIVLQAEKNFYSLRTQFAVELV